MAAWMTGDKKEDTDGQEAGNKSGVQRDKPGKSCRRRRRLTRKSKPSRAAKLHRGDSMSCGGQDGSCTAEGEETPSKVRSGSGLSEYEDEEVSKNSRSYLGLHPEEQVSKKDGSPGGVIDDEAASKKSGSPAENVNRRMGDSNAWPAGPSGVIPESQSHQRHQVLP